MCNRCRRHHEPAVVEQPQAAVPASVAPPARTYAKWRLKLLCFGAVLAVASDLAVAAPAPEWYRIISIKELGAVPPGDQNTFGINADGALCGAYVVGANWHAFVWLPDAMYGMNAGFHDLHTAAGLSSSASSVANHISDNGFVAGVIDGLGATSTSGEAAVWKLGEEVDSVGLGLLTGDWSVAYAINDHASTLTVVGAAELDVSGCNELPAFAGFRAVVNSDLTIATAMTQLIEIDTMDGDVDDVAFDVNNDSTPRIVGATTPACGTFNTGPCDSSTRATNWVRGGSAIAMPNLLASPSDREHRARGNNDTGQAVGYSTAWSSTSVCDLRAIV